MHINILYTSDSKVDKTKKSEDIAISSWVIWVTSSTSYLIYSFIISDMLLVIPSLIDFIMTLMVLALTIKYKGRSINEKT